MKKMVSLIKENDKTSEEYKDNLEYAPALPIAKSSIGLKYPSLRDHPSRAAMGSEITKSVTFDLLYLTKLQCLGGVTFRRISIHHTAIWLKGKRIDDNAEGLWRIHDNLYDLSDFINVHPGGKDWIHLTKGTDITEAFETHHLSNKPDAILPKYFIRTAKNPRNYPFTFHDEGFYRTLKRKISKEIEKVPKSAMSRSKFLTDMLFVSYVLSALMAVNFKSLILGTISGITLSMTAIAAHNFFHQRDSFRMYYFDFTMLSSKSWRVSHALSHHLYTNSLYDLEISAVEPLLQYLPTKKNFFIKYISWLYSPILYTFLFIRGFIKETIITKIILNNESVSWTNFLPLIVPALAYCLTNHSLATCALMYYWVLATGSVHFAIVGVNAGHHHPDIFHDGDAPRPKEELDWGIYQMDAVMDKKDITGSHFLVLTNFGDHTLHHLFPTIDHGLLEYLYPVFLETCKEFGVEWRLTSQIELVKGQYRQLANDKPKMEPPKKLRYNKTSNNK